MKKQMKGFGIYIIILLLIIGAFYYIAIYNNNSDDYNYMNFLEDLKENHISSIKIYQNQEIPTGKLVVKLNDDSKHSIFIEDISICTEDIKNAGMEYELADVERDSIIWDILPYVVMVAIAIIFMSMITAQAGGGGGGKKEHLRAAYLLQSAGGEIRNKDDVHRGADRGAHRRSYNRHDPEIRRFQRLGAV